MARFDFELREITALAIAYIVIASHYKHGFIYITMAWNGIIALLLLLPLILCFSHLFLKQSAIRAAVLDYFMSTMIAIILSIACVTFQTGVICRLFNTTQKLLAEIVEYSGHTAKGVTVFALSQTINLLFVPFIYILFVFYHNETENGSEIDCYFIDSTVKIGILIGYCTLQVCGMSLEMT